MPRAADPFGAVRDRAVHLPDADALVVADLHLGKAATSAVEAPLGEGPAIVDQLDALLGWAEPATVVFAGDVLHAFGVVPREADATLTSLRESVENAGSGLVILGGNHDAQLASLIDGPPDDVHELPDGTVVCHGHEPPATTGPRYVIGHDHPVIDIDGRRRPCVLYGPAAYDGADVLALPSFNPAVPGTTVNSWRDGDPLSPLLAEVSRFHPIVWDDDAARPLVFPVLRSLRSYL